MAQGRIRRGGTIAVLVGMALALAGCLLAPGKFTSTLDIRKDGAFTYRYTGEIVMLGLTRLAQMGDAAKATPFAPQPCTDPEDAARHHPCSSREIEEQRRQWQSERAAATEKSHRDAEAAKAMLGGIDPSDPRAAEELAQRLRRQAGWRSVTYKGDGLFDVDFAISGRLDRDFTFPTIERLPMANAFVTLSRRQDGSVRIDAPGFSGAAGAGPFGAMMAGLASAQAPGVAQPGTKGPGANGWPVPDGQFTLITDATILANNTDEGPQPANGSQRLQWTVGPQGTSAPMAMIRLQSAN